MQTLTIEVHKDQSKLFESCLSKNNCKIADFNLGEDQNTYLYDIETEDSMNFLHLGHSFGELLKNKEDL